MPSNIQEAQGAHNQDLAQILKETINVSNAKQFISFIFLYLFDI